MKYELGDFYETYAAMPCGTKAVRLWMKRDNNSASDWFGWLAVTPVPSPAEQPPAEEKRTRYYTHTNEFADGFAYVKVSNDIAVGVMPNGAKRNPRTPWNSEEMQEYIRKGWWKEITKAAAMAMIQPSSPGQSRIRELEIELKDKQQSLADALSECCKLKEHVSKLRMQIAEANDVLRTF